MNILHHKNHVYKVLAQTKNHEDNLEINTGRNWDLFKALQIIPFNKMFSFSKFHLTKLSAF